jgi:sRNA-binding regulator protein Hfq
MAPRTLIAMIAEYHKQEDHKAEVLAYVINGGKLKGDIEIPEDVEVHPDAF